MKQILEGTHEPNVQSPEVFKNPALPFPVVGSVLKHNWIIHDTSLQPKNPSPFEKKKKKKSPAEGRQACYTSAVFVEMLHH